MRMKRIGVPFVILVIIAVLFLYPMDSYISQPGGAYDLSPLVEVEGVEEESTGTFSLMTISMAKSTPVTYALSRFSNDRKLLPARSVRLQDENEDEYRLRQERAMENSKYNAITVAFQKANIPLTVELNGILVMKVLKKGASSNLLKIGDIIHKIDGMSLINLGDFASAIAEKDQGDTVQLTIEREGEEKEIEVELKEIPNSDGKVGMGIQFAEDRVIKAHPEVTIETSNIGGPSAGFMFTLEILNRLVDEDLTKGFNIAGTGEMLEDGTVGRIGGTDFKVKAAHKDHMDIFFAPDDEVSAEVKALNPTIQSNYEEAVQTAKEINTSMEIVPVKTIDDALAYLEQLEPKK